jgi:hypothetical protein
MATKSSTGPLIRGENPVKPWREKAGPLPASEVSKDDANPAPSGGGRNPGFAPDPQAEPLPQPKPHAEIDLHHLYITQRAMLGDGVKAGEEIPA